REGIPTGAVEVLREPVLAVGRQGRRSIVGPARDANVAPRVRIGVFLRREDTHVGVVVVTGPEDLVVRLLGEVATPGHAGVSWISESDVDGATRLNVSQRDP